MELNRISYEYQINGNMLYRFKKRKVAFIFDNASFINDYFKDNWVEVSFDAKEDGIGPSAEYKTISEEEALQIALSYGMTEENFYSEKTISL